MSKTKQHRGILSSTHVDSHGDAISIDVLKHMEETINQDCRKIRMGVDHRKDFPPRGCIENASLLRKGDDYVLEADLCEFDNIETLAWDNTLIKESFIDKDSFLFAEVETQESDQMVISTDPRNFTAYKKFTSSIQQLQKELNIDLSIEEQLRKSNLPDPEIVFKLIGSLFAYHFFKPFIKKIGNEISENTAECLLLNGTKLFKIIEHTLSEVFYTCIPKTKPVTIVFDSPGDPHVEFIARTRNKELVLKGLSNNRLAEAKEEIYNLSQHINIAKVQFILTPKGRWKFNYLLTKQGEVIGKKIAFDKRDKRIQMIEKQCQSENRKIGLSIGCNESKSVIK